MQVRPFYSPVRGIAIEEVWHDNDECIIGQSIAPVDRILGKDHVLKHCPYCALLNQPLSVRGSDSRW